MGSSLALAVIKTEGGENVRVCDALPDRASNVARKYGAVCASSDEIASLCDFIFLGVKPQMMRGLLEEIGPVLKKRSTPFVLVSMAAGVSLELIRQMCCLSCPIIRIMPNLPVSVGEGMILCATNGEVDEETKERFAYMMAQSGTLDFIDEKLIDAASAVSGCGPAFVAMFVEALADGAVACGISREKALEYAVRTLLGSAVMLTRDDAVPSKLKDAVCSPAGSTIEGVISLEKGAFRASVIEAVRSAYNKTAKLKNQ